ncbi:hypothetical protein Tco_0075585, partial [Tanacetum coccineum]
MERDNRDEFLAEKDKSRKRRRVDQDPPPLPTKESEQNNKKKRHDSDASGLKQPPAPQSSAWKTSNTREAPFSSSKQKFRGHRYCTSSQDQNQTRLVEACTRGRQTGNSKTRLGSFIKWYCRQIGKLKLSKADMEGPTYKVVRAFHLNNISLQFQMEECHPLLTNQVDLVNSEGNRLVPDVGKPLPLGGPPGQLKAAYHPNFGLEEHVPSLWIKSEQKYDISAAY